MIKIDNAHDIIYESWIDAAYEIKVWKQDSIGTTNHIHNPLEFIYVIRGSLQAIVGELSGTVNEGEIVLASSYCPHSFRSVKGDYICIHLPTGVLPRYKTLLESRTLTNIKITDENGIILRFLSIMHELFDTKNDELYKNRDEVMINYFGNILFGLILPKCSFEIRSQSLNLVSAAAKLINEHYLEEISVKAIAKSLLCNQQQLSLQFREVMQMSLNEYISFLRLSKARSLLLSDFSMTLDEIAEGSGFNSTRHFLKCFKEHFGMTPKQMKQENLKK